jgi:hypothetical protein
VPHPVVRLAESPAPELPQAPTRASSFFLIDFAARKLQWAGS